MTPPVWLSGRISLCRGGCVLAAMALLLTGGCGDDGGSSAPSALSSRVKRRTPANQQEASKEEGGKLKFQTKIEDIVGEEEGARIRHRFLPEDFEPDVAGKRNRDPFRSYVINIDIPQADGEKESGTELCKDIVAENQAMRELRLVGIVLRGTRSYALFVDGYSKGHIVTKGDCLGLEQARVSSVRAGFVSLEIIPEATQNQTAPEPQERIIPLYPNELLVEDGEQ